MAKRGAQSTLDHLNWNDAEQPEEAGEFAKASEDVIKQRVIKKARRRVAGDADSTAAATSSVFGGFKGFQSTPLPKSDDKTGGTKSFSFLATLGATANGNGGAGVTSSGVVGSSSGAPMFSLGSNAGAPAAPEAGKNMFTFGSPASLKADSTDGASKPSTGFGISSSKGNDNEANKNLFTFGTNPAKPTTFSEVGASTFTFGSNATKPAAAAESEKKTFTFGSPSAPKEAIPGVAKSTFSFGSLAAKGDSIEQGPNSAGKDATVTPSQGTFSFGKPNTLSDAPAASGKATFSFGSPTVKSDSSEAGATGLTGTPKSTFSFGKSSPKSDTTDAAVPKSSFTFGSNAPKSDSTASELASAGKASSTDTPKSTFSFGSLPPKSDSVSTEKDTTTGSPKPTFSFGSLAAKSDSPKAAVAKSTFSFGSIPKSDSGENGSKDTTSSGIKSTFSFGTIPSKSESAEKVGTKPTFGSEAVKQNAASSTKSTFSFGVPAEYKGSVASVDKKATSFGIPKESAQDTLKKMFGFADSNSKDDGEKSVSKKPSASKTDVVTNNATKTTSGFGNTNSKAAGAMPSFNAGSTFGPKTIARDKSPERPSVEEANSIFVANVIQLNKSFADWISLKVKEAPFCMLHVVFRDYERYFAQLEAENVGAGRLSTRLAATENQPANEAPPKVSAPKKEKQKEKEPVREKEKEKEKPSFSFGAPAKTDATPAKTAATPPKAAAPLVSSGFTFASAKPFTFGSGATGGITSAIGAAKSPTVSFGGTALSGVPTSSPSFFAGASTFGSKPAPTGTTSLFGTGISGGLTFGNVNKPAPDGDSGAKGQGEGGEAEGDEDEPPKVEFTPVEEKDSLYSKRCKLFVKAGGSFSDRGIGTLHIKKVDNKVQLLVRAETSLGNILLNIILNETVPLQRMGKNNVMMVCLPTPESKPPPTSVLLRVKTAEEADELHETLLKYKPK